MTVYIGLLRGINVGGHNKVRMAELKTAFESTGLKRVRTYIQSGNVLFESDEDEGTLRSKLEQELLETFAIRTPIVLRASVELKQMIENCPFSENVRRDAATPPEVKTFYVCMLTDPPGHEGLERLSGFRNERDEIVVRDRDIYLLLRDGVRSSQLANHIDELGIASTVRNWETMNKLYDLARQ